MKFILLFIILVSSSSKADVNPDCLKSQNAICTENERVNANTINFGNLGLGR